MITDSFKKNEKGILLMIASSLCVCFGQLFWKLSATSGYGTMMIGFLLYGIGALIMVIAYRFGSLSVLQPMLSINYVLSILIGYYFLEEQINIINIIGVVAIIAGVTSIAGGD